MARGFKKHLKRLAAPKHWMLDKMGGIFAPRPSAGPHKLRECLPLTIILRNRLKYALTRTEVISLLMKGNVLVDGKVRKDSKYPAGFQDVLTLPKSGESFRLLFDVKGRFILHKIEDSEASFKLLKVRKVAVGSKGIPYMVTHDGRTIRFPHPEIAVGDTVKFNLKTSAIEKILKFHVGQAAYVTGGHNIGRRGVIVNIEHHDGSFDVVKVRDADGHEFATRSPSVFVIGDAAATSDASAPAPEITSPGTGVRLGIVEEAELRLNQS